MMRKFPKLLAVVLAIAIIICPAMCLTSMAETPANDYTVSYANDVVTVKVDAANGFLVALLRLDVEGFDVDEAGIAVTTTQGVEFGANPDFDADAGVLSLLLAAKDAANINVVTSATVTIPVTKTATDDNYGITLTTIQAADAGSVVDGVLVAEDFIDFPYVADAEDGTIVDAPEEKVEAIKPCTHENTTENTTPSTCTVPGSVTVTCDACGATISSEPLPLANHIAGEYEFDENYHWNVCTYGCSEKVNNAEHVFDNDADADCICGFTREVETHEHTEASCKVDSMTETNFVYNCVCADCGESYTKTVPIGTPLASQLTINKTIIPANSTALVFLLNKTNYRNYTDFVMVYSKETYYSSKNVGAEAAAVPYYTPSVVDEYQDDLTNYTAYHAFIFSDLAAYEMSNNVNAKVYGLKDGQMILLGQVDYSIKAYVAAQLPKANVEAKVKKTIVDMLNFGTEVQKITGFNEANYANADLTEAQLALGTPASEYPTAANQYNALAASAITSTSLDNTTAAGTVSIGFTVDPADKINALFLLTGKTDISKYSVTYEYYDMYGNPVVDNNYYAPMAELHPNNRCVYFKFNMAPVAVSDYPVTATVWYDDATKGKVAVAKRTYSIETWASKRVGTDFEPLAKALYAYANSQAILNGSPSYGE